VHQRKHQSCHSIGAHKGQSSLFSGLSEKDPLLEAIVDELRRLRSEMSKIRSKMDDIQERILELERKCTITEMADG